MKKGKVGGRAKSSSEIVRTCKYCGSIGTDVVRVKSYNETGSASLIWECQKCLGGK